MSLLFALSSLAITTIGLFIVLLGARPDRLLDEGGSPNGPKQKLSRNRKILIVLGILIIVIHAGLATLHIVVHAQ